MSGRQIISAIGTVFWVGILGWQFLSFFGNRDDNRTNGVKPPRAIVDEHDGEELVALMRGAHEAVLKSDSKRFKSLFARTGAGETAWSAIQRHRRDYGNYLSGIVMTPLQIDRVTADIHVRELIIQAWYDFRQDHTVSGTPVHHTTWRFRRDGDAWKLDYLRIDTSALDYDRTIPILMNLSYSKLVSLNMDWEASVDPRPVLAKALRAMAREDVEALKQCSIGGVILHAHERDIELPASRERRFMNQRIREYAEECLYEDTERMWRYCRKLETTPTGLIQFFTAYRIVSMPSHCTQVKFYMGFDGNNVPAQVGSFSVAWSAKYVSQKWLAASLEVKGVRRASAARSKSRRTQVTSSVGASSRFE
ncbi:MAG: hypothetical protein GTO29_13500 [Candidatus Latescibacteria bacterium]|nr:hypothetical protein [Candidatus Latescibacterota bacterium]NIO57267.1 hypothetical protein [Candidatus Latescibacterota bacterium]